MTKTDTTQIGNGTILNWKFSPGAVSGETGLDHLIDLMDVYFEQQGMQSQFSIVGRETMLAALLREEYGLTAVAGSSGKLPTESGRWGTENKKSKIK